MRALVLSLLLVPAAVPAATLSLPVHRTSEAVAAPYYAGDVLELTLTPEAARVATGAGPTRRRETLRLGLARVDAEAGALGATFTSEFVGERAPTRGERGAIDFTRFVLVHLPEGASLETAIDRFAACPEVAHVSPIAVMPTTGFPDDSLFPAEQWLYRASTPRHDIHAPEAWDVTQGDTSIVVAIVDTGILPYHPDLGGTIAGGHGNIWINLAEQGGLPGVDDDGNGFVDDTWGWDFVTGVSPGAPGEDTEDPDDDPDDFVGHGTMVAGIVGALTDNTIGIAGVSPQVRLMALRIGWLPSGGTRPGGSVRMDFAAQAIRYATRMGASVINCSWSSDNTNGIDAALTAATRAGVAIANASGNFSSPAYLATRNDVIAVGATDSTDAYWSGTEAGTWLDLVADGVGITSTYLSGNGPDSLGYRQPAYSPLFTGTSFSSPQVAGAIALLQAQRRAQGRPPLPPMGAALRLRETGDDISAENPGQIFLVPRLDVARALTDPPGSFVTRGSALTVGPPVVLHYNTGVRRVIYATSDAHLLATDEATGDTAWCVALPANPVGALAGAEIGKGFGIGLFVGTDEGTVLGYRDDGTPLPGWPQRARNTFTVMSGGVALGDLDGDGQLDVVCGGSDGYVWAWHAGGSKLTGFPFFGASGAPSAPALANLDGQPGDEIVFTDATDVVHAVGHDGAEQWEWSGPTHILAPQILRLGHAGPLAVLLAAQGSLAAVDGAGNTVWSQPLAGTTPVECALADLDGDGSDDILVASGVAVGLSARDSTGQPIARAGWPFLPQASPDGPLVAGPLRAGAGLCVGFHTAVGFSAYDDAGQVVPAYPKPKVPGAGVFPALDDVRGDGATVVISGAAADSNLYDLDAGQGSWNAAASSWSMPRGNDARTGSRLDPGGPAFIDRIPPAAVHDLAGAARSNTTIALSWTITGGDSLSGRAASVELRRATFPLTPANFAGGTLVPTPAPDAPGTRDSVLATGLLEGASYWFALRVADSTGNASALSNVILLATGGQPPGAITDLRATLHADTLVTLAWTAVGRLAGPGAPQSYAIAGGTAPFDSAQFAAQPFHLAHAASVDSGGTETQAASGLTPGRRWYFAVQAIDSSGTPSRLSNLASVLVPIGGALRGRSGIAVAARTRPSHVPVAIDWQGLELGGEQTLGLFDLGGRQVRRVDVGSEPGGTWNWDGRDGDGRSLPAGLYFVRLLSGGRYASARIVLIR